MTQEIFIKEYPQLIEKGVTINEDNVICYNGKELDAYGHITWSVGNNDDFICFDFLLLPDDYIAMQGVVNSETGSFIDTYEESIFQYKIIFNRENGLHYDAVDEAKALVERAFGWLYDNEVRFNKRDSERSGQRFVKAVKIAIREYRKEVRKQHYNNERS